jgi:nucleoside-diphosphate-sugar epimerase
MNISLRHAALVGATGPTGRQLAPELLRRGLSVRVVSRSESKLERCFPGTVFERAAADACDSDALQGAIDGCDLVVDCIGLPPDRMADHELTARNIATLAHTAGARCLQVSSCWSFLPIQHLPVTEDHPRVDGNVYARARRAAEDAMLEAGAAVVHLPDFFGPHGHTGSLQRALEEAASGKAITWMGSPETAREYVYVPDAMAIVADLCLRDEAYGGSWIVPGPGPLDARRLAEIAGRHLGRKISVRAAPRWLLRALSLVSSDLRAFSPILDDYLRPVSYDARKLERLLGPLETTPYEVSIPATLDALRDR